ncbi:MAG: pilus (MSHA type) biogenesis protein MshL [Magnetococcales bacterium]|nr:pilus (MSHA type) biogenesis protein MshL [Magnetococcales bacterium]NGZ26503.1 pilus (MSHA type) biogenesis protein MshL [Magnetococcales bacterium]
MRRLGNILFSWVSLVSMLGGCQSVPQQDAPSPESQLEKSSSLLAKESQESARHVDELRQKLERTPTSNAPAIHPDDRDARRRSRIENDILQLIDPSRDFDKTAGEKFRQESMDTQDRQQEILRDGQKIKGKDNRPVVFQPTYNPLDDILISLEMDNADVRHILSVLSKEAKINLLLHPDLLTNPRYVSVSFHEVPLSRAFTEIMQLTDLYGEIKGNLLRVDPQQEAVIHLDMLETNLTSSFEVGGDVLGSSNRGLGSNKGGNTASTTSIKGGFQIRGTGPAKTNPYDYVEDMLRHVFKDPDQYHINRQTGTLFLRARPSAVRNATKLIENYRQILARQILIEARIMEIRLDNSHQAGIDWNMLSNQLSVGRGISQSLAGVTNALPPFDSANVTRQLLTTGTLAAANTQSTAKALSIAYASDHGKAILSLLKTFGDVKIVSNPTIRAKHAQPAMISVGQSSAYVKEVKTTNTTSTVNSTETQVEVDSVFNGLLIGVVPFITEGQRVSLTINPVKSEVDMSNMQETGTTQITLPRVELKELSTVLDVNNGDTVFLGGLIDKDRRQSKQGVPVLSDIPLLGGLFTTTDNQDALRELVIMLHVTVL